MGQKRTLGVVVDSSGAHRRDLDARDRVLATAMKMLGEHGYSKLTIGGVAAEAGVGKATLYRSWPNKAALVLDVIRGELRDVPTEDLGDSRAEMLALASQALGQFYGSERIRTVLPALVGDLSEDSALRQRLWEEIVEARKKQSMTVMERALGRGDLPADTDVSLVLDMWAGTMLFRALFSADAMDDETIERFVDATIASPPRTGGSQPVG
ncbi:TetR/AcrR family transcriptional regulator [Streptomyces wuyuanensis]|uniref:DNA-binding transcriptional regulator, AcrR family n=1 Tax=Streptomyces wuyuanensis TaxID=1196353 RepID=A0A1G9MMX5_9ACTN|nr:TetR/AcrR family transcriptional regulator [Streptomyces wuyuanensis]SDL75413.1 DNA-binding transcriptional regulator, AcrR family [Streptomyces wuyuanensis]